MIDFDEILSDLERDKIAMFMADTTMREAVRKVVLAGIYYNGTMEPGKPVDPTQNFLLQYALKMEIAAQPGLPAISDAEIGSDFRAEVKGIRKVEQAWLQLEKLGPAGSSGAPRKKINKGM